MESWLDPESSLNSVLDLRMPKSNDPIHTIQSVKKQHAKVEVSIKLEGETPAASTWILPNYELFQITTLGNSSRTS